MALWLAAAEGGGWLGTAQAAVACLRPPVTPPRRHPRLWLQFPGKKWFLFGMSIFAVGNVLNFASFGERRTGSAHRRSGRLLPGLCKRALAGAEAQPGRTAVAPSVARPPHPPRTAGFAAQSLLAALGVVQFLSNMVFARFLNNEAITRCARMPPPLHRLPRGIRAAAQEKGGPHPRVYFLSISPLAPCRRVMFATALVVTGCILLVSFGNHESPIVTGSELLDLYSK